MRISFFATLLLAGAAFANAPKTIVLAVENMTCAVCPITVKKALEKVPGVTAAAVDFEHKTATVQFDQDKASAGTLIKATTEAGFPSALKK